MTILPSNYHWRVPTLADADAVSDLINVHDLQEIGTAESTPDDIQADWERPRFVLEHDARLIVTADGQVVAYGNVWAREPGTYYQADNYIHPAHWGRGLGTALIHWMETRARETLIGGPAKLIHYVVHSNATARQLFEQCGFQPARYSWRMVLDLEAPPAAPHWPEPVTVASYALGTDEREAHALIQEAFSDLEDFHPTNFDDWLQHITHRPDFLPAVTCVARAEGQMVGVAMCFKFPEMGWVRTLAVRRAWRKRGLGLALLQQVFGNFYRQGERRVGLGVDAHNATGATRLYQRAGMRIALQFDQYQKILQA